MRKFYIIAGPNGAGKTTAALDYLKNELDCLEYVNADSIAAGISPFQPEKVAVSAGKIMLERISELINRGEDLAVETTLASKVFLKFIEQAHKNKYLVILLFFWLDGEKLAIERVSKRIQQGGHSIPEDVICRRYRRGLSNFFKYYSSKVDFWLFLNNCGASPLIIAEGNNMEVKIVNDKLWESINGQHT